MYCIVWRFACWRCFCRACRPLSCKSIANICCQHPGFHPSRFFSLLPCPLSLVQLSVLMPMIAIQYRQQMFLYVTLSFLSLWSSQRRYICLRSFALRCGLSSPVMRSFNRPAASSRPDGYVLLPTVYTFLFFICRLVDLGHSESQPSLNGSPRNLHTTLVRGQGWKPTF